MIGNEMQELSLCIDCFPKEDTLEFFPPKIAD